MFVVISVAILFGTLYYVWYRVFSYQGLPKTLSFAGSDGSFLSRGRASFKSVLHLDSLLWAGHVEVSKLSTFNFDRSKLTDDKHTKVNRPYILPDLFTGHQVILPKSQFSWLTKQPASVLSQRESNNVFLAADHTFLNCVAASDAEWTFVVNVIKQITKELNNKTDDIIEEINDALALLWGSDDNDWKEIDLLDAMLQIMSRVVSRVYVGLPLCRDATYIGSTTRFAKFILVEALLIQLTPNILRPLVGPVLARYDWVQFTRQARRVSPIIKERVSRLGSEKPASDDAKRDLLTELIEEAYRRNEDPCQTNSQTTRLLAILNWAAIQVQAITLENVLIDLAHAPDSLALQQQLREEAAVASRTEPPSARWTRAEVAKLPKIDSVLTESLRLWGFSHGVVKVVVAKDGVTLPSGEHIPCGAKIGVGSYGIHHDDDVYPGEQFEFDPLRFTKDKEPEKLDGLNFAKTNENYLAFSHGKYSCAGRFFANHLMKLLFAQMLLQYDIKPNEDPRPRNPWLSYVSPPPFGYKLSIRKRTQSVAEV